MLRRWARCYRSGDLTAVWVPDEGSEALRDLVRAREAAKQDQLRARHRLSKFLLRTGRRPAMGLKAWTERYLAWVQQIQFSQPAQEFTLLDYLHEVQHMDERVQRLEQAIAEAVKLASPQVQEVIRGLQALRGVAHLSAVTIAAELGNISRFESARKLMGYSGAVPSEDSSGQRQRRGNITKTGNAHLRRIAIESAWSYRFRPAIGPRLRQRQAEDHHRGGTRTAGLRLGHRDQSGNGRQAADGGMKKDDPTKSKARTFQRRKKQRRSNE